jgi:hypothetical protein
MNRIDKVMVGVIVFCLIAGFLQHFLGKRLADKASGEKKSEVRRVVSAGEKWDSGDMHPYVQGEKIVKIKRSPVTDYSVSIRSQRQQAMLNAVKKKQGKNVSLPAGFDMYEARVMTENLLYSDRSSNRGKNPLSDEEKKALVEAGVIAM